MKTLNNEVPKIESCRFPNNISLHELYLSFIFALCLRGNYLLILRRFCQNQIHPVKQLNVHEINHEMQILQKDQRITYQEVPQLSTLFFHFSIRVIKQYCALQHLRKTYTGIWTEQNQRKPEFDYKRIFHKFQIY